MPVYICLLRGINVGGKNKIKMLDLKTSLERLGYTHVLTYIQSGNIIFNTDSEDTGKTERTIQEMLLRDFGFEITAIILTPSEVEYASSHNPFENDASKDPKKFYVVFLKEEPTQEARELLATFDYSPEAYHLDGKIVYFYAANGAHKAKMNNNFFESKLSVKASTRNWRTVHKLLALSK